MEMQFVASHIEVASLMLLVNIHSEQQQRGKTNLQR